MMSWKSSFSFISFISKQISKKSLYIFVPRIVQKDRLFPFFTIGEYLFTQRQFSTSVKMECCGNTCGPDFSKEALKQRPTAQQYQVTQEKDTKSVCTSKLLLDTSMATEYEIRHLKKGEIPEVLDMWSQTEVLLGGTEALNTWFEYDPEGFLVAVSRDGTIIGACAGVINHDDLAVVGMYAVKPEYRGQGIGLNLCDRVRERYGSRNAVANPVTEKLLRDYRDRGGYPTETKWQAAVYVADKVDTSEMVKEIPGVDVCPVSSNGEGILEDVADYDASVIGFSRSRVFPSLCGEENSATVIARNSDDGSVCGYGMIKKDFCDAVYLGPLYADNKSIAEVIVYNLLQSFQLAMVKRVAVVVIDCNEDASPMFERLGFRVYSSLPRLYRYKEEKNVLFEKIFSQLNDNFTLF